MTNCVEFLRWALPRLGYAWPGYRHVHRQVCKRVGRRLGDLGLGDFDDYRRRLESDADEWRILDGFCRIPISRFGRDWATFDRLAGDVLPILADAAGKRGAVRLEAWSAGCARGEEPYTLAAVWRLRVAAAWPGLTLSVLATDADAAQLERARLGVYRASSARELPSEWKDRLFESERGAFRVRPDFRQSVSFQCHDVRDVPPRKGFDLILCRNLVLTYFDEELRRRTLERLLGGLNAGGAFVVGAREAMPPGVPGIVPWWPSEGIYRSDRRGSTVRPAGAQVKRVLGRENCYEPWEPWPRLP